ncbi:MAG: TetR/AcrR family transcriptional regulator C-terminal domain-containing protein [Clostridia bacterium]|nr:TetR/AcrR family transcriptional regulator C-terminal domain-containing protein [Clostridia bacterium]
MQKEDLRVRKTKKALSEAFFALLNEKPFEEITINELCERADVRRATFYKHYTDKFNFLTSVIKSLRDRFDTLIWKSEKPDTTAKYYVAYAKRVVGFITENEQIINNLMNSDLLPSCFGIIVEQNYIDTRDRLEKSTSAGMKLCAPIETVAMMCAGGVAHTIYEWLAGGMKKDPDVLADEIGDVVLSILGNDNA